MRLILKALLLTVLLAFAAAPVAELSAVSLAQPRVSAPGAGHSLAGELLSLLATAGVVAMGIRIKDTGFLAKKFVRNAGQAGGDYTEGVKQAGSDWEANTKAAGDNWAAGVQQAIGDKRFDKGVSNAGAAKYVERASTVGANRYPQGVAIAENAWSKGVQPHLDAMKGLNLPPRRPKGDPGNRERAHIVADRNRAIKLGK